MLFLIFFLHIDNYLFSESAPQGVVFQYCILSPTLLGRGDFQFFSRIFLAFCAYPPMTIRFNIVYLKMSVSIWETPRHDPI